MPKSQKSQVILSTGDQNDQPDHFRNDRFMDGVNSSCKEKNIECVKERSLRRKLNDKGSQSTAQIATSKSVKVEVSTSSSSGDIDSEVVNPPQSEDHPTESSNHIASRADEHTPGRVESRVDGHDVDDIGTMSGRIVKEGGSEERLTKSTKLTQASKMQWPKWTVSHMLSLSTMDKVMNYYRVLNLADNLNDKELRCFLEEQLLKEKAGLSEMTITNRLRTKLHVSETAGEPDSCSICMVDYKDRDKIASLYYCSHVYHADCIKEWLLKNNLCPMCRALAIIPEDYPYWNGDVRLHQAFFVHLQYAI